MSKKYLVLSLLLIFLISFFIGLVYFKYFTYKKSVILNTAKEVISQKLDIDILTSSVIELDDNILGILKIPKIELEAPIQEKTTQRVLRYSIGHFENSSTWNGNVCLASHNRGSLSNYFARIDELTINDEIIYKTKLGERRYKVTEKKIIESTDWSVITNTKDNSITLITCVKNKQDKRLCIKGIEK